MSRQSKITARRTKGAQPSGIGKSAPIVVVALLLPAVLFSVFIVAFAVWEGGRRTEANAVLRAHDILEDVEVELARETQGLEAVAASLTGVEIPAPRPPADRLRMNAQLFPQWVGSIVWRLDTREALFSSLPWEQMPAIPVAWQPKLAGATGTIIAGIEMLEGRPMVFVHHRVPDDPRNLVLTTALKTDMFQRIVVRDVVPETIIGVMDADGIFIARSLDPGRRIGTPATTFVRAAIASGKPDGTYRGRTLEGMDNISAFARSPATGWSAHIAFSDKVVDASTNLALLIAGIGALTSLAIAAGLTWLVVRDARRRQRAEVAIEQAQRVESLGRLTGGIAHDFNNLLTVIIGNLERSLSKGHTAEPIETALVAARRAADLTRSLLAYSRQQVLSPRIVDANECVQEAVEVMGRTIGEKFDFRSELDPDAGVVKVDPSLLVSALVNLVVNARDAMPSGGQIVVRTKRLSFTARDRTLDLEAGNYVAISVADTGPGMAPEIAARAFEPFFTTKEVGKGTGLGLSQVQGFVDQSGGKLRLVTAVGKGTTITLYFPQAARIPDLDTDAVISLDTNRRLRILLVEDDVAVREHATRLLEDMGHEVRACVDGGQAKKALSEQRFDLLFSDIGLPGDTNGPDLAKFAHGIDPDIAVVLATGYAPEQVLDKASEHHVVMKPYDAEQIRTALANARVKSTRTAMSILIVDDEPLIQLWAGEVLAEAGYAIQYAGTLQAARAALATGPISVAIVDVQLPDGSGLDLVVELQAQRPEVGIIIASGNDFAGDPLPVRLSKPYDEEQLLAAVRAALDSRRRSQIF